MKLWFEAHPVVRGIVAVPTGLALAIVLAPVASVCVFVYALWVAIPTAYNELGMEKSLWRRLKH